MTELFYSAKILTKTKNLRGQFAQNLKNGSDIYEHVQKVKSIFSIWFGVINCHLIPTKTAAVGRGDEVIISDGERKGFKDTLL